MLSLPPLDPPADLAKLLDGLEPTPELSTALAHAWVHAPFLRGLIRRMRGTVATLVADGPEAAFAAALATAVDPDRPVAERLRAAKAEVALLTALADLSGLWSLEQVTDALSRFADLAIDASIAAALAERDAPNRGLVALALGKLGSFELNYSSDVDLILIYDPAVMPLRPREDPGEGAVRISRRVVALMSEVTPDGYVFRVDLRLRPSSEITPIALPVAAAEHYYQSEALTWERVAFIRARACAGDIGLGEAFLRAIRGFVWRRSLDYTAIRDIQSVSLRIREHDGGQALGAGFDLKRGRGGIREVEFFAQIHQMIWGGRDERLRVPATLDALAALDAAGRIEPADATNLAHAYRLLRTVEHRLQMRADEQTHAIPRTAAHRAAVAALCGAPNYRTLERRIGAATKAVARRYDRLVAQATGETGGSARVPVHDKALKAWLKATAPAAAATLAPLVVNWREGKLRALRSPDAQAAFEALLPALVTSLGTTADPARAATRLDQFLAQLPAGLQFFALLAANPALVSLLARLLGVSPWLADTLARSPALFDVLLGADAFAPMPPPATLLADLELFVGTADIETILDRVRRWTGERRFQLGAQLVEGAADPLRIARDLAALADAAVGVILHAVSDEMARTLGTVGKQRLMVVGLGRYGGGTLTHASDLDLVYLFTGGREAVSSGARALPATEYFNRLAARLTAALSVATAAGPLYEIDTRLRPWGAKGLLAVSVDSFTAYEADEAETWEHMALTRARVVAGEPSDRTLLAGTIATVVEGRAATRDAATLRKQVLAMRADITAAKPGGGVWDVKLAPGGLVDVEFIVHFLQLRDRRGLVPDLREAVRALIPDLIDAHDLLTRVLVTLRLVAPDGTPAVPARALLARVTGVDDVEKALGLAKAQVIGAWTEVFGSKR